MTISGPVGALADFGKVARKNRWALKRLDLDYPFHCALVEPIRDPLLNSLAAIEPHQSTLPMVSSVTGAPVDGAELGANYWWDNVRQPVLFSAGGASRCWANTGCSSRSARARCSPAT